MAGLQSLIQGGNKPAMPGQAGAFTALPAQQGRNPVAYTRALKQIPPEDLIRIYNDPNDMRPKWAVASAYADAMKAKALQQGVMGQQAQAQNAAAQQTPPVADQVMAVMAASGGEMKSAPGGEVGDLDEDIVAQLSPEGGEGYNEDDRRAQEEEKRRNPIRQQFQFVLRADSPPAVQRMLQEHPWLAAEMQPARTAATSSPPAASPATGVRDVKGLTPIFDKPAETLPAAEAPAGLSPYSQRLEKAEEERNRIVREGATISPEVLAARQRMEQLSAGRLQRSQQDAEKIRSEGIRQLQGRIDAARRPLIDDPEALLSLAASINPQRGKTMGSLAGGLSSILAGRRARAEKAEEGISVLNEKVRLLNSQYQEAEFLEEQRKYAIQNRDADLKRETDQKIADNNVRMRQTQAEIDIRLQDVQAKKESAQASRESVAASREGSRLNMLTQRQLDRERVVAAARKRFEDNTVIKMAKQMAESSDATAEHRQKYQDMLKQFKAELDEELAPIDESISRLRQLSGLGAAPAAAKDMSGWGQMTITEPPKQ
jgi:hypothetical protein